MSKIKVTCEYSGDIDYYAELPEGKTWYDVDTFDIHWDYLFVRFKGQGKKHKVKLVPSNTISTERPVSVTVYDRETNSTTTEAK